MQASGAIRRENAQARSAVMRCERSDPVISASAVTPRAALWIRFASLAMTWRELCHTGSAIEYFTWLSAKLNSIEAMPSSRVSLFFRNAS